VHAAELVRVGVIPWARVLNVVKVAAAQELAARGAANGGVRMETVKDRAPRPERLRRERHGLHEVHHQVLVVR